MNILFFYNSPLFLKCKVFIILFKITWISIISIPMSQWDFKKAIFSIEDIGDKKQCVNACG